MRSAMASIFSRFLFDDRYDKKAREQRGIEKKRWKALLVSSRVPVPPR